METTAIVLSVKADQTDEFEAGFREHELPIWEDFVARGIMLGAWLNRMDISTTPVAGAVQYLITVVFATGEGHHLHDSDPRFQAWNALADRFQLGGAQAFGGPTVIHAGG